MAESLSTLVTSLVSVGAGGVVGFLFSRRLQVINARREDYAHVDTLYPEILRLYLDHPRFGDAALTDDYQSAFQGDEARRYHFFAMHVHSFLETVFDKFLDRRSKRIVKQWAAIFEYHARLHRAWLQLNPDANEVEYRTFVLGEFGAKH